MSTHSPASQRWLVILCLAAAGWAFGFGLGAPLASLWLQDAGFTRTVIGLNTGVYYFGIALASLAIPWMMRRWGHGCPAAGMLISGLAVALFPWTTSLEGWFGLRWLNGLAGAMSLIPLEALVNRQSPPEQRARNFGFYAFAIALGWALGNLIGLQMYSQAPRLAFFLGGSVSGAAGAVFFYGMPCSPWSEEEPRDRSPMGLVRHFLSFGSAWSQGFLEGGMVALLPVYLLAIGLTEEGVSWLTSGIMIGVILFQVPVAWLADRLGRTTVLVACYLVTAAGMAFLPFCGPGSVGLASWLFLVGACSGAFYPLGLALLGEKIPGPGLARANAWYLAINCLGSLTGPVITGFLMDGFGNRAMFLAGEVAVLCILLTWSGLRWLNFLRGSTCPDQGRLSLLVVRPSEGRGAGPSTALGAASQNSPGSCGDALASP